MSRVNGHTLWYEGGGEKIETKQLKTFLAVYSSGSFTRAAKILDTSQPAVSEQIKGLEKELRCRLFDRMGRSIQPTSKASILYPRACSVIEAMEAMADEISLEDTPVGGELIIGASTIPGAYIIPRFASLFQKRYPQVSFEVRIADSGDIIQMLTEHKLLLGIVGAQSHSPRLSFNTIVEDDLVLVSSGNNRLKKSVPVSELLKMPFLLREEGSGTRKSTEEAVIRIGIAVSELNVVAVFGSNAAIKEAIKEGLGVSILSRISVRDELECGSLRELGIEGLNIQRLFYAVTLKGRSLPRHYSVFLHELLGVNEQVY